MFSDTHTRSRLLQALRDVVDIANAEEEPAAASGVALRWLDRELRGVEVVVIPRSLDAVEVVQLLGDELRRAVSRGLADDEQASRVELAAREVIDNIEDDLEAEAEFRFLA